MVNKISCESSKEKKGRNDNEELRELKLASICFFLTNGINPGVNRDAMKCAKTVTPRSDTCDNGIVMNG